MLGPIVGAALAANDTRKNPVDVYPYRRSRLSARESMPESRRP
jgi:hypothetical protein